jgi:hypothetical protein
MATNVDVLREVATEWKRYEKYIEAKTALEHAMKARSSKDGLKH